MNATITPLDPRAPAAPARRIVTAACCLAATAILGTGCANLDAARSGGSDDAAKWDREVAMNQRWQSRPLSHLVAEMGEPRMILTIPGGGNPPGFAAVYGRNAATGCLDAFALVYGADPTIRSYHCR